MIISLSEVIKELALTIEPESRQFSGIENDSRSVKTDYIYVAIKGYKSDGHQYIESAIKNGASCVVVEAEEYENVRHTIDPSVVIIAYSNTRKALALLSRLFYQYPSRKLRLIGVTGTNGKTTITYMIREILRSCGIKVGLIGTICNYVNDRKIKSPVTTPDALELNRLFHEMVLDGVEYVVMEVSSHALFLDRVYGLDFDCIAFTNLSEDHLDFHSDMEDYLTSKELIFDRLAESSKGKKSAILNHDLDFSERLIKRAIQAGLSYQTFGIKNPSDFQAIDIHFSLTHSEFTVMNSSVATRINKIKMPGDFNIYNSLVAFAICRFFEISFETIQKGFETVSVPGRFELVESSNGAIVIIDYAHTDDALLNVINTIRDLKPKRVISVFGCGGDRDKGKRPLMGEMSGKMSDLTIVTSDNPRTEKPEQILDDIIVGIHKTNGAYLKIVNRYEAIKKALEISEIGDVILIAGKGHEDYQVLKDKTIHFDDKETAKELIGSLYG